MQVEAGAKAAPGTGGSGGSRDSSSRILSSSVAAPSAPSFHQKTVDLRCEYAEVLAAAGEGDRSTKAWLGLIADGEPARTVVQRALERSAHPAVIQGILRADAVTAVANQEVRGVWLWAACRNPSPDACVSGIQALLEDATAGKSGDSARRRRHVLVRRRVAGSSTPLYLVASAGHVDAVQALLDAGAKVDSGQKSSGETPLVAASRAGHGLVVDLLLKQGADPSVATSSGTNALLEAARSGCWDAVDLLLKSRASHDVVCRKFGGTPLWHASRNGHVGVVKRLLSVPGIDVHAAASDGTTPLHTACSAGWQEAARVLLGAGADPFLDVPGVGTPGDMAFASGHENLSKAIDGDESDKVEIADVFAGALAS